MRYKHFKNADIDVSELAVGTWGLDSNRWSTGSSREEAIEAISNLSPQRLKKERASERISLESSSKPRAVMFSLHTLTDSAEESIKVALFAPRLSASSPI